MAWHYRVKAPDEKVRDPIQGEFFSTEAIKNPADALVRESIQNALDAKLKGGMGKPVEPLRVRFFLAAAQHALPAEKISRWFQGSWEHFHAKANGLRDAPKVEDSCPFLVFEDFNTTGLQGDVRQSDPIDDSRNSFFYFFRAEGRSSKSAEDRGRWGVGKYVFPRSSRVNAFFGVSVRNDDKMRVLMGHSVFKSHRVEGKFFCPDGYYGIKDPSGLVLPITDQAMIDQFCRDFSVKRTAESGLSVVMPWVDSEITAKTLVEATVRGYFFPILNGSLAVTVETPEKAVAINKVTLCDAALMLDDVESRDVLHLVDLAEWASTRKFENIVHLAPCAPERPEWSDDLIPPDQLKNLRKSLESGDKVAVRATVTVREKGKAPCSSHFDFYLWKDGFESGRPVFIREGLIISDVRAPRARGYRSLVVAESGPLASLLGDAENPAHTEWQSKGENFRGKYTYGPSFLDFVTNAVANFVRALTREDEDEDASLLSNIFSLPSDHSESGPKEPQKSPKKKKGHESDNDVDPQEPRRKRFRLIKADGGFCITNGDAGTQPPSKLTVRCAYDTRGKNPLNVYKRSVEAKAPDFQIGKDGVQIIAKEGVQISEASFNRIVVSILQQDFRLSVTGFDKNRDLFVNVKMEEEPDDSEI